METISIRNLRGSALQELARHGKPLGISDHRVLVGVMIPVATAWVERLIDHHWLRLRQSIDAGEQALRGDAPLVTLDSAVAAADAADSDRPAERKPQLTGAIVGGALEQDPGSWAVVRQLSAALGASGQPKPGGGDYEPSVRQVRMGDLSAKLIGKAGEDGQVLALTHDRELIGVVIPVTQDLVRSLIEENMSGILHSIQVGEKQLRAPAPLTTLDEAVGDGQPARADHPGQGPASP